MPDEKNFAELERVEDKYLINLSDLPAIQAIIEKNMAPAYPDKNTDYVMINTLYLDSPDMSFFKFHSYQMKERIKVRIRKYGPNGTWDNQNFYLEIKEKEHEDVRKYRIQLDDNNLDRVKRGLELKFNEDLLSYNEPLYTATDLKRYIEKYNKIVMKNDITPILSVTYKRLAYGKGALRITLDTGLRYKPERIIPLSTAFKIKKAVDWKEVKKYGNKYNSNDTAILEIKHNTTNLPVWLKTLLDTYKLEPERFSKYVYSSVNMISRIVGE